MTTKLITVAVIVTLIASIALCAGPFPSQAGRFQISSSDGRVYMVDTSTGELYTTGKLGWQWTLMNKGVKDLYKPEIKAE